MRTPSLVAALNAGVLAVGLLSVPWVQADDATARATASPVTSGAPTADARPAPAASADPTTAPPVEPAETPPPATTAAAAAPTAPPTTTRPPRPRTVSSTGWAPYATVGPLVLHYPGDVVEVVGLHQSGHDGAQPQSPVDGPARAGLLETRGRDTHPQGAADIVVDPSREVRSPVTGTVIRAGTYTLYCDHTDHYLVVEPDARPGWEVKVLHFEGLSVAEGDRVEAGVTRIGANARVLPFRSQVDDHTGEPAWPHLHVEVVDPSIPDRPSGGSCD